MEPVIGEYLGQIKVGRKQSYRNLALFPLLSKYRASLDYVTLDEPLKADMVEIGEIEEGGSDPEIKFIENHPPSSRVGTFLDIHIIIITFLYLD